MLGNVLGSIGSVGLRMQKYIPEIAMGVGAAMVVFGTIDCCKSTAKADYILDNAKKEIDKIHEEAELEKATGKEVQRKLTKTYFKTGLKLAKHYGPGAGKIVFGLTSMFYGYGVLNGRYVGTVALAHILEDKVDVLEKGIVAKYGEDVRDEILYGIETDDVEFEEEQEDGTLKTNKVKKAKILPEGPYSDYAVIFDSSNPNWEKNSSYNLMWLRGIENYCNDLLNSRGHVFLNDVYDALGYKRTPDGAIRGWVKGISDDYISFGIDWEDGEKRPSVRRFLNGIEPTVWLDFNNPVLIWDKI